MIHSLAYQTIIHQYLTELYLNAGASASFTFTNVILENIEKCAIPYNYPEHGVAPSDWTEFERLDTVGLISINSDHSIDLSDSLIELAKLTDVQNVQDFQDKINDIIEHDSSQITLKVCELLKDKFKEIKPTMISIRSEGLIHINLSFTPYSLNKKLINDLIDLSWSQIPFITISTSSKMVDVSFDVRHPGIREIVNPYEIYDTKNTIKSLRIY